MMKEYELHPVDGRKSFYGKARVLVYEDGTEVLKSYDTMVLKRKPDGTLVRLWHGWSATTGRHIKAFCGLNKAGFVKLPFPKGERSVYTVSEVLDFAERYGKAAAASWLLLITPDRFLGNYEDMMDVLCGK